LAFVTLKSKWQLKNPGRVCPDPQISNDATKVYKNRTSFTVKGLDRILSICPGRK